MKLASRCVLVRVQPVKEQDESGIYIQEEWQSQQPIGEVESVADDVEFCQKGDKVWFERYTSIPHPEDRDLRLCREDAILAVYEK